ncbi:MAG: hypothetical protein IPN69_23290 [Acidobacteria bacterium]|nr:hypothetical protein [Acidobacteriota bacterium]
MYENRHGRFTAVDPLLVSGTMRNPQSFNRFLYVQNDPTNLLDPSGLTCEQVSRNGENKQYEVKNAAGQTIGRYFYDGEGKRVKKITWNSEGASETTIFVYSAGELVAEYSNTQVPVPNRTTRYLTEDHLGTPRVITDSEGNVISRRDFLPFGEEITPDIGARASVAAYQPTNDSVRQKFTGYQKDTETGLDFAEARMYENRHGRFTAVDPLLASGKSANPQTFNRFVYVQNDPINLIDPFGLACENIDRRGDERCIWVAKGNSYGSMWESRFKEGNDLYDAGFTIVENPEAVEPFILEAVHDTDEGPLNTVDEEYKAMIGTMVVLGSTGRFEVRDEQAILVDPVSSTGGSMLFQGLPSEIQQRMEDEITYPFKMIRDRLNRLPINPTKWLAGTASAANAGRLYASGFNRVFPAVVTTAAGGPTPEDALTYPIAAYGLWNLKGATKAQQKSQRLLTQSRRERWGNARWKNLWALAPLGEQFDDPDEPGPVEFWRHRIGRFASVTELFEETETIAP